MVYYPYKEKIQDIMLDNGLEKQNKVIDVLYESAIERKRIVFSIGHSTHSMEEFIIMLKSFDIKILIDIRRFPSSKKSPQFNKESLSLSLKESNIEYLHLVDLGGRRKVKSKTKHACWRNISFRGYADYMETREFTEAAEILESIALQQTTVYMCAEAVWWRCHRALVSDYLKAKGWDVIHILAINKGQEHPYTAVARVVNGKVFYCEDNDSNR